MDRSPPAAAGVAHRGSPGIWHDSRRDRRARHRRALTFLAIPAWRAWTTGPLGEEFGWRGYFLPRLLTAYKPLVATLILGILWAIWHYPLYARGTFSSLPRASAFTFSVLCFSIIMTVFWFRTRGNILIAILFHWSVNVSPSVAAGLLPLSGVEPGNRAMELWNLACLLLVTVLVATKFGWATLGSREDFVVEEGSEC